MTAIDIINTTIKPRLIIIFMYIKLLTIAISCVIFSCSSGNHKIIEHPDGDKSLQKSAVVIHFPDTTQVELSISEAELKNDSLLLKLEDSSSFFRLNILKVRDRTSAELEQLFAITDSSYKKPVFTTIEQQLKLDHDFFDLWKDLSGSVKMKVAVLYRWDELWKDTIEVSGRFYAKVE